MEIKVKSKYLKISPRKLRLAADLVRRKNAQQAENLLRFQNNSSSKIVYSLLKSALSITKGSEVDQDKLFLTEILCNQGPRLKRGKPGSKGRMMPITKRRSHLVLTLSDIDYKHSKKQENKKQDTNKEQ